MRKIENVSKTPKMHSSKNVNQRGPLDGVPIAKSFSLKSGSSRVSSVQKKQDCYSRAFSHKNSDESQCSRYA